VVLWETCQLMLRNGMETGSQHQLISWNAAKNWHLVLQRFNAPHVQFKVCCTPVIPITSLYIYNLCKR